MHSTKGEFLFQGYSLVAGDAEVVHVPFPLSAKEAEVPGDEGKISPLWLETLVHFSSVITFRTTVFTSSRAATVEQDRLTTFMRLRDIDAVTSSILLIASIDPKRWKRRESGIG